MEISAQSFPFRDQGEGCGRDIHWGLDRASVAAHGRLERTVRAFTLPKLRYSQGQNRECVVEDQQR